MGRHLLEWAPHPKRAVTCSTTVKVMPMPGATRAIRMRQPRHNGSSLAWGWNGGGRQRAAAHTVNATQNATLKKWQPPTPPRQRDGVQCSSRGRSSMASQW